MALHMASSSWQSFQANLVWGSGNASAVAFLCALAKIPASIYFQHAFSLEEFYFFVYIPAHTHTHTHASQAALTIRRTHTMLGGLGFFFFPFWVGLSRLQRRRHYRSHARVLRSSVYLTLRPPRHLQQPVRAASCHPTCLLPCIFFFCSVVAVVVVCVLTY